MWSKQRQWQLFRTCTCYQWPSGLCFCVDDSTSGHLLLTGPGLCLPVTHHPILNLFIGCYSHQPLSFLYPAIHNVDSNTCEPINLEPNSFLACSRSDISIVTQSSWWGQFPVWSLHHGVLNIPDRWRNTRICALLGNLHNEWCGMRYVLQHVIKLRIEFPLIITHKEIRWLYHRTKTWSQSKVFWLTMPLSTLRTIASMEVLHSFGHRCLQSNPR